MAGKVDTLVLHAREELVRHRGEPEVASELAVDVDAEPGILLQPQRRQDASVLDRRKLTGADAAAPEIQPRDSELVRPHQASAVVGAMDQLGA